MVAPQQMGEICPMASSGNPSGMVSPITGTLMLPAVSTILSTRLLLLPTTPRKSPVVGVSSIGNGFFCELGRRSRYPTISRTWTCSSFFICPAISLTNSREPAKLHSSPLPAWSSWAATLEFPEVFQERGGFDAFVGNPPFLWGMRISTVLGDAYFRFLEKLVGSTVGTADFCVYFLRRASSLIARPGALGLILVDTVSQGDTRAVGLGVLVEDDYRITNAVPTQFWPGTAGVKIARLCVFHGAWHSPCLLDDMTVPFINSRLHSEGEERPPERLFSNSAKSFVGHYLMAQGFVVTEEVANRLTENEPTAKEILFSYVRGDVLLGVLGNRHV
jgi:hypothetical protein